MRFLIKIIIPVCQKWKEASKLSWYDLKKLNFNELMIRLDKREEIVEIIMRRCGRYLKHLIIIEGHQHPDVLKNNCQNIIQFSINLKNIKNGYKILNEDLLEIIKSMTKLKYLKVSMEDIGGYENLCNQILDKLPDDMEEIHLILLFTEHNELFKVSIVL